MTEHFQAADWFTLSGRGRVAVVVDHGYDEPRVLRGETVVIDGVAYVVKGVETHAVPGGHRDRPIGLLVEPVEAS